MEGFTTEYWKSIKFRVENSWRLLALVFAAALILLAAAYFIGEWIHIPVSNFTRDPAVLENEPFYMGILSNLGVVLWTSAATCCLLAAFLLRGSTRKARFLLAFGLFSLYLGLDDLLMFHDSVFPDYLGIDEKYVYFAYGVLIAILGLSFFREILVDTDFPILVAAGFFFAISIFMDHYLRFSDLETFVEDSSKLIGIALWATYFARTSIQLINAHIQGRLEQPVQ